MSLQGRLDRLRRHTEALVGALGTTCQECRRSKRTAGLVHLLEEGEELLVCPVCGLPVTSTGEAIGYVDPAGTYRGKIIVLEAAPEEAAL